MKNEKIGDDLGADDAELSLVRGKDGRAEYLQSGVQCVNWVEGVTTDAILRWDFPFARALVRAKSPGYGTLINKSLLLPWGPDQ